MEKQREFIKQLEGIIVRKEFVLTELKQELSKEMSGDNLLTHTGIMFGYAKYAEQITVLMQVIKELQNQLYTFKGIFEITE